jgi:hypothetical protein
MGDTRDNVEARHDEQVIDATEDLAARIGHWLMRRGYRALWSELFIYLASEDGASIGEWDPTVAELPADAAARFLAQHPIEQPPAS